METFFSILEKVAPYNSFSYTPVDILNIDESGIQIINKPDSVITEQMSQNIHVLISGEKSENISVTMSCNAADKFLPTVLISNGVNEKEDFVDGLLRGSDIYMTVKSSYIGTDSFIRSFTEMFLKNETSAKVILLLDGHRAPCSSPSLFQTVVKSNVNIIHLPSHFSRTLHISDKSFFFGPLRAI